MYEYIIKLYNIHVYIAENQFHRMLRVRNAETTQVSASLQGRETGNDAFVSSSVSTKITTSFRNAASKGPAAVREYLC